MTTRMQPGDWIAKEDIRDEEHLERIREAVRVQGYRVGSPYGRWTSPARISRVDRLALDETGDLLWRSGPLEGRRIDPAELLGKGQTAYSILPKDTESVGHPAADILQQLADEARVNPEPWREFQFLNADGAWVSMNTMEVIIGAVENGYEIRRRPRTVRIGKFDVPIPVREAPAAGTEYWVADPALKDFCARYSWFHDSGEEAWLRRGLIHLDPKSAEIHGRALASLTAQEEQNNA